MLEMYEEELLSAKNVISLTVTFLTALTIGAIKGPTYGIAVGVAAGGLTYLGLDRLEANMLHRQEERIRASYH